MRRVAVIGSGIAGLAAARRLHEAGLAVTIFEAADRPGGHSATVTIDYDGVRIDVDTGFIVYNTLNYPRLTALFAELGVPTQESDMSFALSLDGGRFEWAGKAKGLLGGLFAQKENLLSPAFWSMLIAVLRFQRRAPRDRAAGRLAGLSLGDYLEALDLPPVFRERYLIPMGAAIWSTPFARMLDFPAENFVAFFENHRLLGLDRPVWRTVTGGSRVYVERMLAPLRDGLRLATPVTRLRRLDRGVAITTTQSGTETFDSAVVATHSDQALAMLEDATAEERGALNAIPYRENEVILHRDTRLMPKRRAAWAAWNVMARSADPREDICLTYSMNHLQAIDPARPLFVTLNPPTAMEPDTIFGRYRYAHPQYGRDSFRAQQILTAANGTRGVAFAGAWCGYGFHEDGLVAGERAADAILAHLGIVSVPGAALT